MRLVDKFTIWFIVITALTLIAGGLIVFSRVQHEVDQEAIRRLKSHIDNIAAQLKQGKTVTDLVNESILITELDPALPEIDINVYDTMAVYRPQMPLDRKLTVESSYHINGKHYRISIYDFVAEPDEIADGVRKSIGWIFLILLAIVVLTNLLISRRILSPFHQTLKAIQQFSLKSGSELNLPGTRTKEFQQLNEFLRNMAGKAKADYRALKEFTENASHELQTPLAVIRGKLELLLESPLNEEQGNQILSALNSIERLAKINQSLTLLSKLENQEFTAREPVNISENLQAILNDMTELAEMKSLRLKTEMEKRVPVLLHPTLADILLTNLLSNAIRHNIHGGEILVQLSAAELLIENTGNKPAFPTEQLFERFKRTLDNDDSVGLGLAIVKQICHAGGLRIHYAFEGGRHKVVVHFPS